jgi:fumarate reductase subunit C
MNNNILINFHMQDKPTAFSIPFFSQLYVNKNMFNNNYILNFFLALILGIFTSYKLDPDKNSIINYIDNKPIIISQKVYAQTSINSKTYYNMIPPIPITTTANTANVNEQQF